jgi:hypothetical protein
MLNPCAWMHFQWCFFEALAIVDRSGDLNCSRQVVHFNNILHIPNHQPTTQGYIPSIPFVLLTRSIYSSLKIVQISEISLQSRVRQRKSRWSLMTG